jgi:hypothetical protein
MGRGSSEREVDQTVLFPEEKRNIYQNEGLSGLQEILPGQDHPT